MIKEIKDRQIKSVFLSTILWGLLSYSYLFFTNINNHDNICVTPSGYGAGTSSGRWFLTQLGDFIHIVWGNYNIPFFNSILSIFILGLVSYILVKLFKINNTIFCTLLAGITVTFPTIASTMIYSFTVGYYTLAILLAVLGLYLIINIDRYGFLLGALLYSLSLGIYQAYYPYIATVSLLILIKMSLSNVEYKKTILLAIKMLLSLILGYILYRLFLNYFLNLEGIELTSYKGINEMGAIDLNLLPEKISEIFKTFISLHKYEYININSTITIRFSLLILFIVLFILTSYYLIYLFSIKSILNLILSIVLLLLLPISMNFIVIMTSDGIHVLMQLAFVCLFYFLIILVDKFINDKLSNDSTINSKFNIFSDILIYSSMIIVFICVLNYAWQNNGNYRKLYFSNVQVENYAQRLVTRIESIDGYSQDKNVYIIGKTIDDTISNPWSNTPFNYGVSTYYINMYSFNHVINNYIGIKGYTYIGSNNELYMKYNNEITNMKKFPNSESIKIFDNNIFVRFE